MVSPLKEMSTETEEVIRQLEALGVVNLNATKKMGILEKQALKVKVALKKHPLTGIIASLAGMAQAVSNVTKYVGNNVAMTRKEKEALEKKMTAMQKLTKNVLMFSGASKISNRVLQISNNRLTRLATRLFSLLSIFMLIGLALAAFSVAMDGANSPVLALTEDLGVLHDAMQGLVLVIAGEGDEGLPALFDILAISILAAAASLAVFTLPVSLVIGAIVAAIGVFQLVKNETGILSSALLAAGGVLSTLLGLIAGVTGAFGGLSAILQALVGRTLMAFLGGIGFILAGLAGMIAYMTGVGDGLKGFLLGLVSAILIALGLILVGVAAPVAAIIAAVALLVATIIRYRHQIANALKTLGEFFVTEWKRRYKFFVKGITALLEKIRSTKTKILLGTAKFVNNIVDKIQSIPHIVKKKFKSGFKEVYNAIIAPYNLFARTMTFEIPAWVPQIGGGEFKLPEVTMLAKGGIVNGPTLSMIGEDGPEAVIPLNRKNNPSGIGLGGDVTVNINVGGVTDRTDKKQLAREIGDLIRAEMSKGGRSYGNRRSAV